MTRFTRREFIRSGTALVAASCVPHAYSWAAGRRPETESGESLSRRLLSGWEYCQGDVGGPWEVWRGARAGVNLDWRAIELPHCFNARDGVDPDTKYYQGPGWYRTQLQLANPFPAGRTLLHFEGAGQKSRVYVGTVEVGRHVGGYDEFTLDITDAAANAMKDPSSEGKMPLAVRCDNSRDLEMIPAAVSDFNIYGGLYRYVSLLYVPAISLERLHVETEVTPRSAAKISIRARLHNPGALRDELSITLRILDPKGAVVHTASSRIAPWDGELELGKHAIQDPQLWSPATPALYVCEVTLASIHGEMTISERFGLRYFEFVPHGPFLLNGERLLIRGTQRHEDHAGVGSAMSEELIRREMTLIKEMGANFLRLAHYQQSRIVLDLCDELGFLIWEEVPWCRAGVGGDAFQQQARAMLRNMIDQHYNHPSIILWGLGNEDDWPGEYPELNKEKIRAFLAELNDTAHRLDPSRKTSIRRCDFAKDIPDVYSPSIWAGWYRGRYTEYKSSAEKEMKAVDRFLHMEWGGDSHARRHAEDSGLAVAGVAVGQGTDERNLDFQKSGGQARVSRDGDWSESYICDLFDWHLKEQETMPWLTGAAQWIFKDFATPDRPENPIPRVNQKGLVERDLTIKEGYYVFQSYWSSQPMVHIYGHSWPIRWGKPDQERLVKVYSNCDAVELFLNEVSQGVKKRNSQDFPAAGLRWNLRFASGQNHVRVVARKDKDKIKEDAITFEYLTQSWGEPAHVELKQIASQRDQTQKDPITVMATLFDSNGVPCLDSRKGIRFSIAGDGVLLDNLGTSTGSRVVELYNGRAEIRVHKSGPCTVGALVKGMPAALLALT